MGMAASKNACLKGLVRKSYDVKFDDWGGAQRFAYCWHKRLRHASAPAEQAVLRAEDVGEEEECAEDDDDGGADAPA